MASSENLERHAATLESVRAAYSHLIAEGQGMAQMLQIQNVASGFTTLAGAAMSAVFALQSLRNIFNIINNDDLTFAEKAEQLVMNITMVAAMGIPAFTQMGSAITNIRKAYQAFKEELILTSVIEAAAAEHERKMAAGKMENAAAAEVENKALNKNTTSITKETIQRRLNSAGIEGEEAARLADALMTEFQKKSTDKMTAAEIRQAAATKMLTLFVKEDTAAKIANIITSKAFLGVTLAITAAIALAVIAIKKESEARERRKEILEEEIQKSNEVIQKFNENREHLNELYNQYKETGEASDEFKQALEEQAEALGIANAELYISTERYDALIEKINEAAGAAANYNSILLARQNEELAED